MPTPKRIRNFHSGSNRQPGHAVTGDRKRRNSSRPFRARSLSLPIPRAALRSALGYSALPLRGRHKIRSSNRISLRCRPIGSRSAAFIPTEIPTSKAVSRRRHLTTCPDLGLICYCLMTSRLQGEILPPCFFGFRAIALAQGQGHLQSRSIREARRDCATVISRCRGLGITVARLFCVLSLGTTTVWQASALSPAPSVAYDDQVNAAISLLIRSARNRRVLRAISLASNTTLSQ